MRVAGWLDRRMAEFLLQVICYYIKKRMRHEKKTIIELYFLLLQEIHHTGSYYDRLSCGDTYDFDLVSFYRMILGCGERRSGYV